VKSFFSFLVDKPLTAQFMELTELSQLLSSENLEEIGGLLDEKTDLIAKRVIKVREVKEILGQRVDLEEEAIE